MSYFFQGVLAGIIRAFKVFSTSSDIPSEIPMWYLRHWLNGEVLGAVLGTLMIMVMLILGTYLIFE